MKVEASQLLEGILNLDASDLHLSVGIPPIVRINTVLGPMKDAGPMTVEDIQLFLSKVLTEEQKNILEVNKEVDFSIALGNKARFRVNAFYQKGYPSVALRVIPMQIPDLASLNLPPVVEKLTELRQGLILVVGPTGHGKSTTIASMIDLINIQRAEHIITIEDPIEYVFTNKKSLVEQREMYLDTHSWDAALRSVLRQDPNVVFIGEMRDTETIQSTLTIAETGHLVFATLHTNSASQSVDRMISSFPEVKQIQIRLQLAQTLEAIISQRLLPSKTHGSIPAVELMLASDAVRAQIREGKTYQLDNVISTSSNIGMMSLESSLALLVEKGDVPQEEAMKFSINPELLRRLLKEVKE
jgi:twitching motility protein PilT